jgi:hypothetical protein
MPPRQPKQPKQPKKVEVLKHEAAKRKNIPTAEHQSVMAEEDKSPIAIAYDRRLLKVRSLQLLALKSAIEQSLTCPVMR